MYKIIGADGKEYGPVPAEVVRQWLAEGRANAQTRVLPAGASEWKPLGELPEFRVETAAPGVPEIIKPLQAAPTTVTNPLATIGLVFGIMSVVFSVCCYGLPFNLAGIVISSVALLQIQQQKQQGRGLALAGLALSILSIFLAICIAILGLVWSGGGHSWHRIYHL